MNTLDQFSLQDLKMSSEYDVHQMLFRGTFFSEPHMQCSYACCFKSDSEVNDRFYGLFSGADQNMAPRAQMVGETLGQTFVQPDVVKDGTKQLTSNDVDVAREERHHGNWSMTANTQDSLIAYSSGKNAVNPRHCSLNGSNTTAFWLDRYGSVKHPHSILPNPPDAIKNPPENFLAFNHLLGPSIEESKNVWLLKDFWNKRLAKPQSRRQDGSNSLHSGSSSPSIESLDNRSLLNDDSRSCSDDSGGDFEYHGGEPYKGGEDHNDGRYLKAGNHYEALGQYEDTPVAQSEVSLNMLHGDGKLSKNEDISCPICCKKLKHPYYLRRHMNIHSGIKPFCNFCPRRFNQTGNRNAHMRIHTGDKPFQCEFCGKKFTHASSKRRHTKFCQAL